MLLDLTIPAEFSAAFLAALSGLIVGSALKLSNKFFSGRKNFIDEQLALRKELREELDDLKKDISELREQVDVWRQRYYEQLEIARETALDVSRLTVEVAEYKKISGIFLNRRSSNWFSDPNEDTD